MLTTASPKAPFLRSPIAWQLASLCAFLLAVWKCAPYCHALVKSPLDYPIQIISTQRILHGELPYRDFQTFYGPLGYYVSAFFLWPFRALPAVVSFNSYVFACLVLCYAIVCFVFSRVRVFRPLFLIGGAFLIARSAKTLATIAFYSLPMLLPVVLAAVTVQLAVESPARSSRRALFWQCISGGLIAAEIFIRINFGFYLAFAILLTGVAAFLAGNKPVALAALRCLIAAVAVAFLLLGIFALAGIAAPFITDLRFYLPHAVPGRNVPWKYVDDKKLAVVTAISLFTTLLRTIGRLYRRDIGFWLVPYILLCGFFSYTFLRFDIVHILPFLVFSLLLLGDLPATRPTMSPTGLTTSQPWYRSYVGLPELQLFVLLFLFHQRAIGLLEIHLFGPPKTLQPYFMPTSPEPSTVLRNVSLFTKEADMLHRLDALRKPGDEVFWMSAPGSCQSTFDMCANMSLYLAEDILPRQRIWYFDTVTTPYDEVQQRIVDGLEAGKTPWIGVQDVFVRNTIGIGKPESTLLENYVLAHYTVVFTTDIPNQNRRYSIYARNPKG